MIARGMQIDEDVLDVLHEVEADGVVARIGMQLERPLYMKVNKVLLALGGKWNRKKNGHIFSGLAEEALSDAITTGTYLRPENYGFFETPEWLADELVSRANIESSSYVLEPSAGCGRLARAISKVVGKANVSCFELLEKNVDTLRDQGFAVLHGDFMKWECQNLAPYDAVIMNPPFSNQADIDHVMKAWSLVRPGGRLVSVLSAGVTFRQNAKSDALRELVNKFGNLSMLPDDAFLESGTRVKTVYVVLEKEDTV